MYKGTITKRLECLIHIIYWLLISYFTFVKNPIGARFSVPDLFLCTYFIVFIITFYFHYLIVMKAVFKAFNWKRLFVGAFVSYLVFTFLRFFFEQIITKFLFDRVNYTNVNFFSYMLDNLHYSSMSIILSSFLWFVIYSIRLLEYNKLILEENKNTEIKFLKAQINPHFVFNTLNNIYSMVYFQSDKSLIAIDKLSQIMRFTTYESQKEKIKLSDEVDYIKAYIELEQLRHQDNVRIDFNVEIENQFEEIPPYILSPLVENALKHGEVSDSEPIEIQLKVSSEKLIFKVKNKIGTQKKDSLGGIGLDNLQKRLQIHYPEKHQIKITKEENHFTAELEIDLK
ncbi:sensor histidine kinase [Flavobacterium nitrogenifigens]|uniref:Histidine kinase n=1 Tax=Flavobacterium nitrogenifigens TaxID=1617283 RepID=A0A521F4Z0_9FLAO|nr:histidine kinase [Flavobacterium nitrogenifigens]KAF2336703.1 histidine kinase [Flavobacterium nitrogenifigens]SMO91136.1 Histidine kinase [Flavobacterium nitrogenifigens]